jgi:F0F1-type ATP synthase delta subunit
MEQAYAQALWQMVEGGTQPKKAVHALVESLKMHGREALLPRIARAFDRLAEREMHKNAVIVSVAHERDTHAAKKEVKELFSKLNLGADELQVQVNESLIGGWRLEGKGLLVDKSYRKQLLEMYNHAVK